MHQTKENTRALPSVHAAIMTLHTCMYYQCETQTMASKPWKWAPYFL